jgi:hypothetical protein
MSYTIEQLKSLEKKLVSDLESVRRVMALNTNPDLIRVSELLNENKIGNNETKPLFESPTTIPPRKGPIKNPEIADLITKFATPFKLADVRAAIGKEFPDRQLRSFSIPAVLRNMIKGGEIKEISPREGRNGATYAKI